MRLGARSILSALCVLVAAFWLAPLGSSASPLRHRLDLATAVCALVALFVAALLRGRTGGWPGTREGSGCRHGRKDDRSAPR